MPFNVLSYKEAFLSVYQAVRRGDQQKGHMNGLLIPEPINLLKTDLKEHQ